MCGDYRSAGDQEFLKIEEEVLLGLRLTIVSSLPAAVIYSLPAIKHLQASVNWFICRLVCQNWLRLQNMAQRGVVMQKSGSLTYMQHEHHYMQNMPIGL